MSHSLSFSRHGFKCSETAIYLVDHHPDRLLCLLPVAAIRFLSMTIWPSESGCCIGKKQTSPNLECFLMKSEPFSKATFLQNSQLLGSLVWLLGLLLTQFMQTSPLGMVFLFCYFLLLKRKNSIYIYPLNLAIILLVFCPAYRLYFFFPHLKTNVTSYSRIL